MSEEDRAGLKEVLARCPELDKAAGHVRDFGEILTDRLGSTLPTWIEAVDASQLPGLTGFALHLLRDLDAVTAGLTLDWSSGSIEGAVNRIKKIKRQLYGRAGFRTTPQDDPPSVTLRNASRSFAYGAVSRRSGRFLGSPNPAISFSS
ncbi:transposase [Streptomyces sp. NPDC002221]|uniref:transposase n=1 Tax=Streptomyces sp. NPDC002221 TaxID=3364639 RepID=UPI0036CCCD9C